MHWGLHYRILNAFNCSSYRGRLCGHYPQVFPRKAFEIYIRAECYDIIFSSLNAIHSAKSHDFPLFNSKSSALHATLSRETGIQVSIATATNARAKSSPQHTHIFNFVSPTSTSSINNDIPSISFLTFASLCKHFDLLFDH